MTVACERCGTAAREVSLCDSIGEWHCLTCAEPYLPTAPEVEGFRRESPDPFARPLDRLLASLRLHCGPDAYTTRGLGVWWARCPLHPDTGYSLLVTELPGEGIELCCRGGCPEAVIRELLDPDPEREGEAKSISRALVWAQTYRKRRAA
jgi:hypothetical protein